MQELWHQLWGGCPATRTDWQRMQGKFSVAEERVHPQDTRACTAGTHSVSQGSTGGKRLGHVGWGGTSLGVEAALYLSMDQQQMCNLMLEHIF